MPAVKSPVPRCAAVALTLLAAAGALAAITHSAVLATPAGASVARDDVPPCADGRQPKPGERCKGPVDNTSGGGGGALTIVVSVVVGLAIAGVAFVVLRRQLATSRPPTTRPGASS